MCNQYSPADPHLVAMHYTMPTVNADADPLISRMHRPDPKLPPDQQDKRSVVVIEPAPAPRIYMSGTR